MATIILAWEYERDISHITRLNTLRKHLVQMGHQVYFIGSHLPILGDGESVPFLAAPRANPPLIHKPRAVTKIGGFGDRLALLGFNDAKTLQNLVATWDTLFDLVKPDLLICDCAPVASLAAYQYIPCIQLSDGLSLPPHHLTDFPRLRTDAAPIASTQAMLKNVQFVQSRRNKNIPAYLPSILQSEYTFICHVPEFDPYLTFRSATSIYGPFSSLPTYSVHNERDHFFAYLDLSYPDMESVIIGLTELEHKGIFFLPNASYAMQQFITQFGHTVCQSYPALNQILHKCAYTIHHGNIAVAEASLAAGIPQFTIPANFESDWISLYLADLNVSIPIYPDFHPITTTSKKINAALTVKEGYKKHALREWAILRAQHLTQKNHLPIETAVISACECLLA